MQEVRGEVKPYQVRQVIELIESYGLTLGEGPNVPEGSGKD